jgi:hypothetical protein
MYCIEKGYQILHLGYIMIDIDAIIIVFHMN